MRRSVSLAAVAASTLALAVLPSRLAGATPSSPARPAPHRAVASRANAAAQGASVEQAARAVATQAAAARSTHLTATAAHLQPGKDGTVRVAVSGSASAVAAAVHSAGGRTFGSYAGTTSVRVAKSRLASLAAAPGVTSVDAAHLAYETDAQSAGVQVSGALDWQNAGDQGAGTKIAIVDAGFAGLSDEIAAGHFAANQNDATHLVSTSCDSFNNTQHGTAVAEIVHEMAPSAELFLFCVSDNIGFNLAVKAILDYNNADNDPTDDITIGSSSLAFPLDSRGDGSGSQLSTASAVRAARQAGVLWVQAAGNYAQDHWGGTLADANGNHIVDMHGGPNKNEENDIVRIEAGQSAQIALQWDQWPATSLTLSLAAEGYRCLDDACTNQQAINPGGNGLPTPISVTSAPGDSPTLLLPITNSTASPEQWTIFIRNNGSALPSRRYDLTYFGVDAISANACPVLDSLDLCVTPPAAYAESVSAPASSPFALGVGAHYVFDQDLTTVEDYSSRGPTIDGRTKPDMTGYDGTDSYLSDFSGGFFGTSAAAPHVAGAAALVKALHPAWDASQIQNFLELRADNGSPTVPANNDRGFGLLTLGNKATSALPAGSSYQRLATPQRILDTRTTVGGHHAKLGKGQSLTVTVPGLPIGTTAVAINLTGVGAQTTTYLSAYPGGTAWPRTSNLNLTRSDPTAAVFAIVTVNSHRSISIRNDSGLVDVVVDEVGYFGPAAGASFSRLPLPLRVLDTRTTNGGHNFKVPSGGSVVVDTAAPPTATAAVVNITTVNSPTASGYVSAAPTCSRATSTLNFNTHPRANMAIVGIDSSGQFCISNFSGAVDVLVDVLGYMDSTGAKYVALPSPKRIMDTRTGNGPVPVQAVSGGTTQTLTGSGLGEVPFDATALFTGVVEASATGDGYVQAFPGTTRPVTPSSTLNFSPGRIVANAAVIGLDSNQLGFFNSSGQTQLVLDLFGYFE